MGTKLKCRPNAWLQYAYYTFVNTRIFVVGRIIGGSRQSPRGRGHLVHLMRSISLLLFTHGMHYEMLSVRTSGKSFNSRRSVQTPDSAIAHRRRERWTSPIGLSWTSREQLVKYRLITEITKMIMYRPTVCTVTKLELKNSIFIQSYIYIYNPCSQSFDIWNDN